MKKSAIFLILMLPASLASFAQGNGMAGISEATNMVTSYFDPLTKLIFAVAAVLGLSGYRRHRLTFLLPLTWHSTPSTRASTVPSSSRG